MLSNEAQIAHNTLPTGSLRALEQRIEVLFQLAVGIEGLVVIAGICLLIKTTIQQNEAFESGKVEIFFGNFELLQQAFQEQCKVYSDK